MLNLHSNQGSSACLACISAKSIVKTVHKHLQNKIKNHSFDIKTHIYILKFYFLHFTELKLHTDTGGKNAWSCFCQIIDSSTHSLWFIHCMEINANLSNNTEFTEQFSCQDPFMYYSFHCQVQVSNLVKTY